MDASVALLDVVVGAADVFESAVVAFRSTALSPEGDLDAGVTLSGVKDRGVT